MTTFRLELAKGGGWLYATWILNRLAIRDAFGKLLAWHHNSTMR